MSKDPRIERTHTELKELYDDQLKMLAKRCDSFYEGDNYEARDIASILRTLLHDSGKTSQSVLKQIGEKDTTRFLDSRVSNNLTLTGFNGNPLPRTPWPYRHYNDSNLHSFEEWWSNQPFQVVYRDINFTREELVLIIANQEGGAHVAPKIHEKIAALKRSNSPWKRVIENNEDGTQSTLVWFGIGSCDDPQATGIYDFELATICAIGEEVLFSLTPEPENRKRMHSEGLQGPYYLSSEEIEECKRILKSDLTVLDEVMKAELSPHQHALATAARGSLADALEIEAFTSQNMDVRNGVTHLMNLAKLPWDANE